MEIREEEAIEEEGAEEEGIGGTTTNDTNLSNELIMNSHACTKVYIHLMPADTAHTVQ